MNLPKKNVACSFMLFSIWDSLEFDIQKLPDMRMKSSFWSLKQNTAEEVIGRYLLKLDVQNALRILQTSPLGWE